jgi:hypothetical protein
VRRQAVGAAVGFGHGEGDPLAVGGPDGAPAQGGAEAEIAVEDGRSSHRPHHQRRGAELRLNGVEQLPGATLGLRVLDRSDTRHDGLLTDKMDA